MSGKLELPPPPPARPRGARPWRTRRGAARQPQCPQARRFYARSYTRRDKEDLETYAFKGLQDEIAALRLLNRRAISQALLHAEDCTAFLEASRIVIGLTVALNATIRTQIEIDLHGGSEFDAALQESLLAIQKSLGLGSSENDALRAK